MSVSLNPFHLARYKDIASLFLKYGRTDLVRGANLEDSFLMEDLEGTDERPSVDPEKLAKDLEQLGPTFIKLGQFLSTRPDLISSRYIPALSRLQDDVGPFSFNEVEKIVSEELGVRISKGFQSFEATPLAAASLSQVHRARLRDGRQVAVKVQRPGIRKIVFDDLESFAEVAQTLEDHTQIGRKYAIANILDSFRRTLLQELDFRREADNLVRLAEIVREYDTILVPQPIPDYYTSRVLTMDYIEGTKISALSPLVQLELDGDRLAADLSHAYLDQILIHGFIHADPHPGNVLITPSGKLALVDLGMVAYVPPRLQDQMVKLLLAVSEGRPEEAARIFIRLGPHAENSNLSQYMQEVTDLLLRYGETRLEGMELGRIVLEMTRIAADNGIRPVPELALLGKVLLNLDQVAATLAPDFNPNETIRDHIENIVRKHLLRSLSPGSLFSSLLEMYDLLQQLPSRINTIIDRLSTEQFEIRIRAFDESILMANVQKIANRITLGLVLAALIVGAALLMQVPTSYTLFGYPALAIIFFTIAAVLGFTLVIQILLDEFRNR